MRRDHRRVRRLVVAVVVAHAVVASAVVAHAGRRTPWARVRRPSRAEAQAIGGTSAGCVAGAVALPRRGPGFRVMRPERRRHFGHPLLVAVVRALGASLAAEHVLVGLGDASQPRGGPAPDGHASHQTGLDVDVWYAIGGRPGREAPVPRVDHAAERPTPAFGSAQVRLLRAAVADARVDRVFVNPVLKRALCDASAEPAARAWLHKVRPWWGHDEHFHLRLACPLDSPACVAQPAIAPGDGCDELTSWLDPDPAVAAAKASERAAYRERIAAKPALPATCDAVLRGR